MDTINELRGKPKEEPAPAKAAPKATPPPRMSGGAWSVGPDVKVIQSTPDHKPPTAEDTIEGRYAGVLFTTASQQEALYNIYEDITYLDELYKNSESFRLFT